MIEPEYDMEDVGKVAEYDSLRAEITRLRSDLANAEAEIARLQRCIAQIEEDEIARLRGT